MRRLTIVCLLLSSSGCLKQLALGSVADALSGEGGGLSRDDDPELVRDSLPVIIETMEQIHDGVPRHRGLTIALTRAITSYGAGFVQEDADRLEEKDVEAARVLRRRARRLFLRARGYGLEALDQSVPGLGRALGDGTREQRAALLARAKRDDVAALYWTAAAWGSAIANAKDDMKLVGELPQVRELVERALALDESYGEGSIHELLLTLDASQGNKAKAKEHFERALALSHGKKLGPLVTWAEVIDVDAQNKKEFTELLDKVVAFDVDSDKDHRLPNIIAQRRARWLLGRTADLFVE
jgi:predicted anti-sigma-YlaC factor YlaD